MELDKRRIELSIALKPNQGLELSLRNPDQAGGTLRPRGLRRKFRAQSKLEIKRMIPVILDTDIGIDVDDHWAVAMVLGNPELDVKLITVSTGDVEYRAN